MNVYEYVCTNKNVCINSPFNQNRIYLKLKFLCSNEKKTYVWPLLSEKCVIKIYF